MATSTPASANSPANISPVGPAPAIATACPVIATLQSVFHEGNHALRGGPCRKSPGASYTGSGKGRKPLSFRVSATSPNLIHRRRHLFCCVDFLVKSAGRIQNRLTGNQMVAYYVMELNGSLL